MGIFDTEIEYTESGTAEGSIEAVMRRQNQVSLSIIGGPTLPIFQLAQGTPATEIAGTSLAAGIETWLFYQYLGQSATFAEKQMAKHLLKKAMLPYAGMTGAVYLGVAAAVEGHRKSSVVEKTASLGGIAHGKTQKRRMSSLGGL